MHRMLGISPGWIECGVDGIIANLVFAYNVLETYRQSEIKTLCNRRIALSKTNEWLVERKICRSISAQFVQAIENDPMGSHLDI